MRRLLRIRKEVSSLRCSVRVECDRLTPPCAVLASADLSTLTKKGVRQELESYYGMELGDRKALVNRTIEHALGL